MRLHPAVVTHAEQALREVMRFDAPADVVLTRYFRDHPKVGSRERGAVSDAVYAVLRNRPLFSNFAETGMGPMMRRMALIGLAETFGADALGGLSAEESDWLVRLAKIDRSTLPPKMRAGLPSWLHDKLADQYGEQETQELAESLNSPAPLDLRVNTMKAKREDIVAALAAAPVEAEPTPYSPLGLRVKGKPALQKLPVFEQGMIEVQDEGSQLLAQVVGAKRGEMVADFCAGAGGKTLALGASMRNTGRLYAFDVSDKRLARLKPRLAKSGLSNVHPVHIANERDARIKRFAGKVDRVLVDAPCSGTGRLRREPDLKWRLTPESLAGMAEKQKSILDSAARLVKAGGRLVYATCSLLREENEEVVQDFLAAHPDFALVPAKQALAEQKIDLDTGDYLKLLPHRNKTDGFFAAVLERKTA